MSTKETRRKPAEAEVTGSKSDEVDEDEVAQDWSEAAKVSVKSMTSSIPKRGEKDYEPDGTNVQELLLFRAREAMFETLANSPRGSAMSNQVKAYYDQDYHGAMLPHAKGNFLQTMGTADKEGRCWLKFHEFVYLAERGTILPFYSKNPMDGRVEEVPLSMQDVYSLFKSQAEMDLYFVYAHLKRLGFIVAANDNRDRRLASFFPPRECSRCSVRSVCESMISFVTLESTSLLNAFFYSSWNFLLRRHTSSAGIYGGLKRLISYQAPPKNADALRLQRAQTQYDQDKEKFPIAFDVWKPQTSFRKRSPGLPDFQVVIHSKGDSTQTFPSYVDLRSIFNSLDYKFDFLADIEDDDFWINNTFVNGRLGDIKTPSPRSKNIVKKSPELKPFGKGGKKQAAPHLKQIHRLKSGYRSFLLAVIDDGLISFVKISEADFGSEDVWYVPPKQAKNQKKIARLDNAARIARDKQRQNSLN